MQLSKEQIIDFVILVFRWYLAFYMADYGWAKISGGQFGVANPKILDTPVKDVSTFYLAWHLFSLSKTFNVIVGCSQILAAILLVINRTTLIGALMLLPILFQIFLIDIAFTTSQFGYALPLRLSGMMFCDLMILIYYRQQMLTAFAAITTNISTRLNYAWWVYILLPVAGFLTDFIFGFITWPLKLLLIWLKV